MMYIGPRFLWIDVSRVQKPPRMGQIITIEELQARRRAEGEVAK
jgi:hypothetical protein